MVKPLGEVEIKLYVPDLDAVADKLLDIGGRQVIPRVHEYNIRYENEAGDLTQRGIVVRLRKDTYVRLTYKEPPTTAPTDDGLSHRFEAEVEVDDFDTMELILNKLGYSPHLVYEKYRTTYVLDDVEVDLDEMPYGNFVELEGEPENIYTVMDKLGLNEAQRYQTNYVQLFENVKKHLNLIIDDITFANFEGIDVPQSALNPPSSDN